MSINNEIKQYYDFIIERENIRLKKERGEPRPWTEDPLLQEYKFTNIYREEDAGTKYYLESVIGNKTNEEEILFLTVAYRLVNEPKSWDELQYTVDYNKLATEKEIKTHMDLIIGRNGKVFNGAYMILGNIPIGSSKTGYYGNYVNRLKKYIPTLLERIKACETGKEIHILLMELENIGAFMAYELYSDLVYNILPFDENEFVNIGHGALPTLKRIYGDGDRDEQIRELQKEQSKYLPKDWKPLTLRNIEHCCCEYRKYHKLLSGGFHTKYIPNETGKN